MTSKRLYAVLTERGKVWYIGVGPPNDPVQRKRAAQDAAALSQKLKQQCMLLELTQPLSPELADV